LWLIDIIGNVKCGRLENNSIRQLHQPPVTMSLLLHHMLVRLLYYVTVGVSAHHVNVMLFVTNPACKLT